LFYKGGAMFCPNCDAEMKLVPAGVSKKTLKPYNAFWSCPECKEKVNITAEPGFTKEFRTSPLPVKPKANGTNADMRLSYRKDLMCSVLDNYSSDGTAPINVVIEMFKIAWEEVEK